MSAPRGDLIILATVCFSVPTVFFFTLFSAYFLFLSLECKLCEDGKEGFSSLGYNFRCFFIIPSLWPPIPDWGRHHSQLLSLRNSLGVHMRSLGSDASPDFAPWLCCLLDVGSWRGSRRDSLGQKLWEQREPPLPAPGLVLCGSMPWHDLPRHSEALPALLF